MVLNYLLFLNKYFSLLAFIVNFILGLIVYFRNKRSVVNLTFALMSFNLAAWCLSLSLYYNFPHLFWVNKLAGFLGFSLATTFILFIRNFPTPLKKPSFLFYFFLILWQSFLIFILILGFLIPNWFIKEVTTKNGLPLWEAGLGYNIVSITSFPYIIYFFYLLYTKYKKTTGIGKMQFKYLFLGLITFGLSISFLLILDNLHFEGTSDLASSVSIIMVGLITYAIVRHRLWDIRLVLVKSLTFSLIIVSLASLFIFIVYFLSDYFSSSFNISPNATFVIAGLLIAFGFAPFKGLIERLTNNLFYKKRYNPSLVLKKLTEIMRSTLDLETLTKSILSILKEEMRLERISLILINQDSKKKTTKKSSENVIASESKQSQKARLEQFPSGSPLLRQAQDRDDSDKLISLIKQKDILVTDELSDPNQDKEFLREQEIAVLIPLKLEKRLLGILILSEKKSGDMYSLQDINFLILLSSQLSVACNNSLSFDEVVRDREKIKRLLKEREELDKMKDEFIAIASHEVNTPLSIAQGYLSLVLEGTAGKLELPVKTFVSKTYTRVKKINSLLGDLMKRKGIMGGGNLETK